MPSTRAVVGIAGPSLSPGEATLLATHQPAGVILFGRNVADTAQLARLVENLRALLPDAVLMVDQEGGRVARLRPPHFLSHPACGRIGAAGERAAWLHGALIGLDAAAAGFDVVCAPVLDVRHPGASDVVGDRAFSTDSEIVARCGAAMATGLLAAGVQPVAKHAPGHGRARIDSHVGLPEVDGLSDDDTLPFHRNLGVPWWMTAHVVYRGVDTQPATCSRTVVDMLRDWGFAGLIVSDDLAMGALDGNAAERARRAWDAGCDLALYCPGDAQTADVLAAAPPLAGAPRDRLLAARAMAAAAREDLDRAALDAERAALLAVAA